MEEKKTKRMMKAEAFEWLKNKKIRCIDGSGNHFLTIMSILENIGFRWSGTNRYEDYQVFCLFTSHNGRVTYLDIADAHEFNDELEEEVLMGDILSIEIIEEKYELEFNYDKVVELAKPLMHYLNEVGCKDSIRISQVGIVHEPMSTLLFDNGIGE